MRDYYSHSQAETFSACGLKYNFKYVQGIKRDSKHPSLVFGSSIHKAIEHFHISLYGTPLTESKLMDIFENEWENFLAKQEIEFKTDKQRTNLFEVGLDIMHKYYKDCKDCPPPPLYINPAGEEVPAVEIDFNITLDSPHYDIKKPITGKIDLITEYPGKSGIFVIDHKTSSYDYTEFKVNTSIQLALYAYAFRQMLAEGRFPGLKCKKESFVGYNIFKKQEATKKNPENTSDIIYTRKKITDDDISHMLVIYGMMDKAVTGEIFLPNYGFQCGYCEYNDICMEYKYKK